MFKYFVIIIFLFFMFIKLLKRNLGVIIGMVVGVILIIAIVSITKSHYPLNEYGKIVPTNSKYYDVSID